MVFSLMVTSDIFNRGKKDDNLLDKRNIEVELFADYF